MENTHDIVPTHLVVNAMRDNGYKNAAYAIAELMDNSIQAGATIVELLCGERIEQLKQRARARISEIAVLDNGHGMTSDVLQMALQFGNGTRLNDFSGIGRFGMGLPNSSISQARRVEVWSWRNGSENAIYSYLDIDEIEKSQLKSVPTPIIKEIPDIWKEVGSNFGMTGTLVVWKNIDKIMWRTANSIIDNSELIIGRMYRYFLVDDSVVIKLKSFDMSAMPMLRQVSSRNALPNDPLYLFAKTSCPEPFDNEPMFENGDFKNTEFEINFNDSIHVVTVKFAYAKESARTGHNPGARSYGKHAAKNLGVSIVRANRELDLDTSWSDPSDPRDRWWGVEVNFPPALDDLFGVTNNKQSARNFSELAKVDLESLLEDGQTIASAKEYLDENEDPRLPLIELAQHIRKNISTIRRLIKAQTTTNESNKRHDSPHSEEKGTEATRKRQNEGYEGKSDTQERTLPPDVREKEIADVLTEAGATTEVAKSLAARTVKQNLKYTFVKSNLSTPAFFDVQSRGGAIILSLNVDHPAYNHLIELLQDDIDEANESVLRTRLMKAREGLELLLMAWARYEDEQPDGQRRTKAQEARWDWGRMAREFLVDE
ncbi:ATP-binding protein [Thiothrix subterranea]|uniref:ATP-binding protein n=1 Tax=Thiothrix subterranea TaxID=2735563 RepID=UPI00192C9944|nr:ATP-binding protein [Thiothrix subterranea]QQZ28832.1 ATP-binding protein [Thiothrix subterranea]